MQHLADEFGPDFWWPKHCEECNAWIERRNALEEAARRERLLRKRLEMSGLPPAYRDGDRTVKSLDDHRAPKTDGFVVARMACARLLTGSLHAPWVYLCSKEPGTYKTTLACVTLQEAIHAGKSGRFVNWPDFVDEWRSMNGPAAPAGESTHEFVDGVIRVPRLVIDEIGDRKSATEAGADLLYRVLNARFELDVAAHVETPGERWVIFTSNVTSAELVQVYADRTGDTRMAARIERRISEFNTEIPILG